MRRYWPLVLLLIFTTGCVAQVRDKRTQEPLYQLDQDEAPVALVDVDLPDWIGEQTVEEHAPRALVKNALMKAFEGSSYDVHDHTNLDYALELGPESEPDVLDTADRIAIAGKKYTVDGDGYLKAYGAPPVEWELVSGPEGMEIDPTTGEIDWLPQRTGDVSVTVAAVNPYGETRYEFNVNVIDEDREVQHRSARKPHVDSEQSFSANVPKDIPDQIEEPLLMQAHVIGWSEGQRRDEMGEVEPTVSTDIVYTIMTRDGEEVDTRRVRLNDIGPGERPHQASAPNVSPSWPHWLRSSWQSDTDYLPLSISNDDAKLFDEATLLNAKAFAYPFDSRKVTFSAQLADDKELEAGNALMDEEDWEGAYEEFERVANDTDNAGAYYNMGIIHELWGESEAALEMFEKAAEIDSDTGMYRRQRDATESRVEDLKTVEVPSADATPKEADAEDTDGDDEDDDEQEDDEEASEEEAELDDTDADE